MKTVAIIQAHMGSTRLPGKVLMDIVGETMLARVVKRTWQSTLLNEVVVATTVKSTDDKIVAECQYLGVPFFRGDEEDVLDRYYQAALAYQAEAVVRITSDCPLIDPTVVDKVVCAFFKRRPDYSSNCIVRAYPRGLDTEIMSMDSLALACQKANEPYQRVHVTPYIHQNPSLFRLLPITGEADYSHYRWTVDTEEDLAFVRAVYVRLHNRDVFTWQDVLELLVREPWLAEINRDVQQKSVEEL